MAKQRKKLKTLRELKKEQAPNENPFIKGIENKVMRVVEKKEPIATLSNIVDSNTGEILDTEVCLKKKDYVDREEFTKVFKDSVKYTHDLSSAGKRVFDVVFDEYSKLDTSGNKAGIADCVFLNFFNNGGLSSQKINVSEKTFNLGMRELLEAGIIHVRSGDMFWINPAVFYKGDRVTLIKEWGIKKHNRSNIENNKKGPQEHQEEMLLDDESSKGRVSGVLGQVGGSVEGESKPPKE